MRLQKGAVAPVGVSSRFAVRPEPGLVLASALFLPVLAAVAVWFGEFEGWRSGWGRLVGMIPFGPQALMIFMIANCFAGLAWLFRIRPPHPILWFENGQLFAETHRGRRKFEVADIASIHVVKLGPSTHLRIVQRNGRETRIGLRPQGSTWQTMSEQLFAVIQEQQSRPGPTAPSVTGG